MRDVALEHRAAARIFLQQNQNFADQSYVIPTFRFKKSALLGRWQVGSFVKKRLDPLPARAIHQNSPPGKIK
jgi:hypothetical protein